MNTDNEKSKAGVPLMPRLFAWGLIGLIWAALFAVLAGIGTESWLRYRSAEKQTAYDRLCALYKPFTVQYLHPNYLFFFPLKWEEQNALANDVCHLVPGGFRGWGPEDRGNRRLAFLIGGSSAFGAKASSDRTTLAGHLNAIQEEYFFVNAGVPSWITTQSLARLVNQLIPLKPDLVVSFEMANDAAIMRRFHNGGMDLPPGTPESFPMLVSLVDDIRSGRPREAQEPFIQKHFPNLKRLIEKKLLKRKRKKQKSAPPAAVPQPLIDLHAAKYVTNLGIMRDICKARGARFLAVIQPISHLHKTVEITPGDEDASADREFYPRFHSSALRQAPPDLPLLDLGACFDRHFDRLPIRRDEDELTPDLVLADRVHLTDRGNEMVAREIWRALQAGASGR